MNEEIERSIQEIVYEASGKIRDIVERLEAETQITVDEIEIHRPRPVASSSHSIIYAIIKFRI